jgi:CDGSH-type Zn-finger protein/uncharacterized Fe-S cluster protein YjdI
MAGDEIVIESRSQLFSALAEAAETEHNLMCLYLYAMFGMKRSLEEGISATEQTAIEKWRKVILGVCLEEMTHLSLVSNLLSAIGGMPHFSRPNFPAIPGAYPAGIVVELAPFNLRTLEHFIYLEHPASMEMEDAEEFRPSSEYHRVAPTGRLSSASGDYKTVGVLYGAIRGALIRLSEELGEKQLFCGNEQQQITPMDSPLRGLIAIKDLKSALTAIETIISQGEGATNIHDSHFERFCEIKTEYLELLKANPQFEPGRNVARNPVMRAPAEPKGRVWITHPITSRYLDLANALYAFMLKILVQIYFVEDREQYEKHELMEISFSLMHLMAVVGESLTLLPVSLENHDCKAGMSFAMDRGLMALSKHTELAILLERIHIYEVKIQELQTEISVQTSVCEALGYALEVCVRDLGLTLEGIKKIKEKALKLQRVKAPIEPAEIKPLAITNAPESTQEIETAESEQIKIQFQSKRCIHSRHCVTERPKVFKANTPGAWLYPENSSPEHLAAVIRECPSGALTYQSKGPLKNEEAPEVNMMRISENGPYRFNCELAVDGKEEGFRATLCRCGLSKNKPFCDHTHLSAGFIASGEPDLVSDKSLTKRGGKLSVTRIADGPLQLKGNIEICASTGHVVLRTSHVRLCRCGHSKSKPICDSTHVTIGFEDAVPAS